MMGKSYQISRREVKRSAAERGEQRLVDVALRDAEVDADERDGTLVAFVLVGIALLADLPHRRGREMKN